MERVVDIEPKIVIYKEAGLRVRVWMLVSYQLCHTSVCERVG